MFRLARLSLANRSVVALVTVIVALAGLISVSSLKQELFPSLEVPSAAIVTVYPGASPEVVDAQVSSIIETAADTIDGVTTTSSTSQSGLSTVRVSFDYGVASSKAKELLTSAVDSVKAQLPSGVTPNVLSGGLDQIPVLVLSVASNSGDNSAIEKNLENIAVPMFKKIAGVKDVAVSGVRTHRINLKLNNALLAMNGLSASAIQNALKSNGFVLPAGTIFDNSGLISVESGTPVTTVEQLKSLPVFGGSFGVGAPSRLTIGDVAQVSYDFAPQTSVSRVDGKPALSISITKTTDGNTVSISNAAAPLEKELAQKLGGDVSVKETFNQAPYVQKSITDLIDEGALGLLFAVIIILLFLFSWRSTAVTAISIPTSILIAFIGEAVFGYSLNLFTLSALTIAIGRVVDDSIVVIENINRHLSYGEEKREAILNAVKEVSGAITSATLTTVAVFLPIAFVGGLIGQLFRPFALTFVLALVASLVVALTIVPVIASWFLKSPEAISSKTSAAAKKAADKIRQAQEEKERNSRLQKIYLPVLSKTQAHPVITLVAAGLVLVFTFGLVGALKTNFIGGGGSNSFSLTQTVPANYSFAQKVAAASKVEQLILDTKQTEAVTTSIGQNDGRVAFGQAAGATQIQVTTKASVDGTAFQADLTKKFAARNDIGVTQFSSGGSFGSSGTVDITVTAKTDDQLRAGVAKVLGAVTGKVTGVSKDITSSLSEKQRTLVITVDRNAAAARGLSEIAVSGLIASAMSPSSIGSINIDNKATDIYVNSGPAPTTVDGIKGILVPTMQGYTRLDNLASVAMVSVPVNIATKDGDRAATVSLTPLESASLTAVSASVQKQLDKISSSMPAGTTLLPLGGVSADQASSFAQLGLALLAAIAIVYLVMVATFKSLVQPLVLLVSIPFAATGAFVALLVTDTALGLPALIGMLLLVGIVVTNAIVLIDLINQYREQGMAVHDAIMNGARQRLRPILMTALATIGALIPLVAGFTGSGGFISKPLGVVVIGGLFSSTVLTLVIVPVLYWLIEGRKERKDARKALAA
jgi:HAE1 family hydrophobic/amphiphilic exporter-1